MHRTGAARAYAPNAISRPKVTDRTVLIPGRKRHSRCGLDVHCTEGELKRALADRRDVLARHRAIDPLITASVPGDTRSDPVDLKRIIDREKRCPD